MEQLKERNAQPSLTGRGEEPFRVLFVCTGNTCRSPMAAAVANARAACEAERELRADSAGLFANEGEPISPLAVDALEQMEILPVKGRDYRTHRAHTLSASEVGAYDLIVGMTDSHVMQLLMCFPDAAERIVRMPISVSDPYGGDGSVYGQCLLEIVRGVDALLFSKEAL